MWGKTPLKPTQCFRCGYGCVWPQPAHSSSYAPERFLPAYRGLVTERPNMSGGGEGVVWLRPYTALSPFKALGWVEGHLTPHRRLNTSGRRETKSMEHFIRGTNYKAKYLGAKPGPSSTAAKQSASLPQELARFPRDRKPLPPVPSHTGISHHSGFP